MRKERTNLELRTIKRNDGQLEWLPRNPRQWTQTDIDNTARSIAEDEDFLEDRPLLVVPNGDEYIVFAGNLRREGAKKQKMKTVPAVVYYPETDEDRLTVKRRAMKDNGAYGSWDYDALANEWDDLPLQDWGVPAWETKDEGDDLGVDTEVDTSREVQPLMLVFGGHKIPMSENEQEALEQIYLQYIDDAGSNYGFVRHLLDLIEPGK